MGAQVILEQGAQFAIAKGESELEGEINAVIDGQLAQMGLSDVPIEVHVDDISPEGLRDAAINGGISYAETELQAVTGLPVRLPRKLSLNELQNVLGYPIPTDFWSSVDLALAVGGQAIASGVTTLLVSAGVGSVVPGLGTVVGVGVAVGINALKTALAEKPRRRPARTCETFVACKETSPEQTPIAVFIDGMYFYTEQSARLAEEIRLDGYCEGGAIHDCLWNWRYVIREASRVSLGTATRMTKPEVAEVLPALEAAPTGYIAFDPVTSELKSYLYPAETRAVLDQLRAREQELLRLDQGITVMRNLDYQGVRGLQMMLLDEVDKAAVAVQNSYGVRPQAIFRANANELGRLQEAYGRVSARQLELAQQLQEPDPVSPSVARRSEALMSGAPILSACGRLYDAWALENPARARCVDATTKSLLIGLCMQAGHGQISIEEMSVRGDALVDDACRSTRARRLRDALVGGFRIGVNPTTILRRQA